MYRCKYFKLKELVHPVTFKKFGQLAWKFLDEDTLIGLDLVRMIFGSLTVNDWAWGGKYKDSGYRQADSKEGSKWSAHRRGCAFDIKSKKYTGIQMRKIIKKGISEKYPGTKKSRLVLRMLLYINEIELSTSTWLHLARTNRKNFKWIPFK